MKQFSPARKRVEASVRESVRILRDLQELSQSQLSELTGIPQAPISAIENGRVNMGVERAKVLARALNRHPAVLAPYLRRTCAVLAPYLRRTCAVLAPYLRRTCIPRLESSA